MEDKDLKWRDYDKTENPYTDIKNLKHNTEFLKENAGGSDKDYVDKKFNELDEKKQDKITWGDNISETDGVVNVSVDYDKVKIDGKNIDISENKSITDIEENLGEKDQIVVKNTQDIEKLNKDMVNVSDIQQRHDTQIKENESAIQKNASDIQKNASDIQGKESVVNWTDMNVTFKDNTTGTYKVGKK